MNAIFKPVPHKLTVEAYYDLARTGHLGEDDRVELIDGVIIEMAPIGSDHVTAVNRLTRAFVLAVGDAGVVSVQNTVTLPPYSAPQPDIAVLAPRFRAFGEGLPRAEDILLVVEVADTTLAWDRRTKMPLYARHGVREAWIVDLRARRIEVYREPSGAGYRHRSVHGPAETLHPVLLPGVSLPVAEAVGGDG